jgi:hypothetical protein
VIESEGDPSAPQDLELSPESEFPPVEHEVTLSAEAGAEASVEPEVVDGDPEPEPAEPEGDEDPEPDEAAEGGETTVLGGDVEPMVLDSGDELPEHRQRVDA